MPPGSGHLPLSDSLSPRLPDHCLICPLCPPQAPLEGTGVWINIWVKSFADVPALRASGRFQVLRSPGGTAFLPHCENTRMALPMWPPTGQDLPQVKHEAPSECLTPCLLSCVYAVPSNFQLSVREALASSSGRRRFSVWASGSPGPVQSQGSLEPCGKPSRVLAHNPSSHRDVHPPLPRRSPALETIISGHRVTVGSVSRGAPRAGGSGRQVSNCLWQPEWWERSEPPSLDKQPLGVPA